MSVMTIQVSTEHVEALRESLLTARRELEEQLSSPRDSLPNVSQQAASNESLRDRLRELDDLLEQIDSDRRRGNGLDIRELTGTRPALWTIVYDAACATAEQLADELNDYWRGVVSAGDTRTHILALSARFELLESLGPPPGE